MVPCNIGVYNDDDYYYHYKRNESKDYIQTCMDTDFGVYMSATGHKVTPQPPAGSV